jgi:hypothetical protein
LDETAVTTTPNGGDGYHGHHPYQENTPDAGTPVWGTTKPALYYDIFVLVYG